MLLHQEADNVNSRGFRQAMMFPVVRLDKQTQGLY